MHVFRVLLESELLCGEELVGCSPNAFITPLTMFTSAEASKRLTL